MTMTHDTTSSDVPVQLGVGAVVLVTFFLFGWVTALMHVDERHCSDASDGGYGDDVDGEAPEADATPGAFAVLWKGVAIFVTLIGSLLSIWLVMLLSVLAVWCIDVLVLLPNSQPFSASPRDRGVGFGLQAMTVWFKNVRLCAAALASTGVTLVYAAVSIAWLTLRGAKRCAVRSGLVMVYYFQLVSFLAFVLAQTALLMWW
jgi:hypothetical protein